MLELFILKKEETKQILLLDDGKLIEFYDEKDSGNRNEGNIFLGIVKDILVGMESAFVDIGTEKNGYIHITDLLPKKDETKKNKKENNSKENKSKVNIRKILKPNDKILVQVKKDSNELKGARISTHVSLPSKYIVLMPNTDIVTVSQKIEDVKEQERLVKLVRENLSPNNGAVIRTLAKGKIQEIIDDIKQAEKLWENINEKYKSSKSIEPKIIYRCQDIAHKILIDLAGKNLQKIVSNDKEELEEIKRFIANQKEYSKIKLETKNLNEIDQLYKIDSQIDKIEKRKVWLKSGGFITIDKTEALTAIDVNTGKLTDGKSFNDIVYKTNEQATKEIAQQIRLRDIGGIIIIDYIDMERKGDQEKIQALLKECLKEDRAKTQVEGFTRLNLMEITRKHICSHRN